MIHKIILSTFLLVAFYSCTNENNLIKRELTYSDFKDNLKIDMTYDSIVAKFGEPLKDIGSGIHIYVYQLTDATEIWIGYTDKILYARHMDKNGQLLESIF
ncbi:MAG: hypothetical protein IPO92_16720 [Saprospiraceae bacterium]|nr:hypothetical protein [Saprospiraceae bacterium]